MVKSITTTTQPAAAGLLKGKTMTDRIAKQLAKEISQQHAGVWGYVDERLRSALIADVILSYFATLDDEITDNQTATWAVDRMEYLRDAVAVVLATKHRMPTEE